MPQRTLLKTEQGLYSTQELSLSIVTMNAIAFEANHWASLPLANTNTPHETAPQQHDLPAIAEHSPQLGRLQSSASARAPYVNQLNTSIHTISEFIAQHAQTSPSKTAALSNLDLYLRKRVNCSASDLKAITFNSHRSNLNQFVAALNNPAIALDTKTTAALELAKGLGVCPEGENLNIYEQTCHLQSNQTGLLSKVLTAKNTLIDQQLLQLVRHEALLFMSPRQAKALEIHQVQALKNHVAAQWGLVSLDDKHASSTYQQQAGKMAEVLLDQTVTPAAIAKLVAQGLRETITTHCQGIGSGVQSSAFDYEVLKQQLELEFGNSIRLADCLDTSDDYSTVHVKSETELSTLVLDAFKPLGLIDAHANTAPEHATNPPEFHALLPSLEQHRDMRAVHNTWTPIQNAAHHFRALAHIRMPNSHAFEKTDDERKKHTNLSSPAHSLIPTSLETHSNKNHGG